MRKVKAPAGGDYELSLSVRAVAQVVMADYCPRCGYLLKFLHDAYPYKMPFPGVFSVLDSVSKDVCCDFVYRLSRLPAAYRAGPVRGIAAAYTWQTFGWTYLVVDLKGTKHRVRVQGAPDVLVRLAGKRTDHAGRPATNPIAIYDNKTATLTAGQDALFPFYVAQVGGYSDIAERMGLGTCCKRGIVYWQPKATECDVDVGYEECEREQKYYKDAVKIQETKGACWFEVEMKDVTDDFRTNFPNLVQIAFQNLWATKVPAGRAGCKNCDAIDALVHLATTKEPLEISHYI